MYAKCVYTNLAKSIQFNNYIIVGRRFITTKIEENKTCTIDDQPLNMFRFSVITNLGRSQNRYTSSVIIMPEESCMIIIQNIIIVPLFDVSRNRPSSSACTRSCGGKKKIKGEKMGK